MRQSTTLLQLQALQTCLFLSVHQEVTQLRPDRVATRPWLAFQAKAMAKRPCKARGPLNLGGAGFLASTDSIGKIVASKK